MARSLALLIGINQYPNLDPRYELAGCVSDAKLAKSILISHFNFSESDCIELYDLDATRRNILAEMEKLVENANLGDRIYVHFAGHGSQRKNSDESESSGLDSTIMPCDSGRDPKPNLDITDNEIGEWLERLSKVTQNITLVFDCCHSGTITRDPTSARTRSVPPDLRSLTEMGISDASRPKTRGLTEGSFLPRSQAYVVISGCRDDELANEYSLNKEGVLLRHGALTYWLCQGLLRATPSSSYQDVFEYASQTITGLFPTQHPQIEGKRERVLFGESVVTELKYFRLTECKNGYASFDGGAAHGVVMNSEWVVYPPGSNSVANIQPLGTITVDSIDSLHAHGRVNPSDSVLPKGSRCVLKSAEASVSPLAIHLGDVPESLSQELANQVKASELLSVCETSEYADVRIKQANEQWLAVASDDSPIAPMQPLQTDADKTRLINNLETKARALNVLALTNPSSSIQARFAVHRSVDGANWTIVDENTVFKHGDRVAFEVQNLDQRDLFFSVLDIGLSGRVSLFYPSGHNSEKLAQGVTVKVGFTQPIIQLGLPQGYEFERGRETFKLMLSTDQTSFDWLQQAGTRSVAAHSLTPGRGLSSTSPDSNITVLMQHMMGQASTRDPIISWAEPTDDWQAINVSFELEK